jgi:hypothetical protein
LKSKLSFLANTTFDMKFTLKDAAVFYNSLCILKNKETQIVHASESKKMCTDVCFISVVVTCNSQICAMALSYLS